MALLSNDEVRLRISAETSGGNAVEQLAQNIDNLARQGGEAAPALGVLANQIRRVAADADSFNASLGRSAGGVGQLITAVKPMAAAIAAAFGVQEVARMAADFDSLNRSMGAIQGQGAKAAAEVAYLTDAANRLGLEVQSVSKTYASWLASIKDTALEGEKGRAVFESVAGAMAKLGKSAADTDGAMMALGQMVSKGKVSMEELRQQLAERLPGAMQAAAAGAGLTVEQLTRMVESGGVLAEDLLPGLARELDKLYGGTKPDGMVSSWNRLKNAVFETVGQLGQAPAAMAAVGSQFAVVKEIVLLTGTAFVTVAEGVTLLAGSLGAVAGAIATGNWSGLGDAIKKMADESASRINNLASQTAIAQGVQLAFGNSVQKASTQVAESASQYLAIAAAYTEVNAVVTKQVELSEKSLAARQAEGKAAIDFAAQFGTEAEKRAEAAEQAEIEAAALQRVAEAKQTAANVAQAQLAALEAEVAAMDKVSPARKKEIEELQRSTALKKEEAAQSTASAQAGQIRAAGLQTESQALADNSKRVIELRAAWQAASTEADTLAAAVKAGTATKEQAAAASIKAGQAESLYRDAVADATVAAQARLALAKTEASLQQSALQNDLYRANTILEIAKQRGNEKEIAQAQIAVWRIELEISEAQAQASRLEAEAMLIVAKAKRAELEASGALTEAKKAELAVMDANIKAKQLEAEKYDLIAARMKSLSYETKELKSGFDQLSNATDSAAASADRAAGSYEDLRGSIVAAGKASDGWSRDTNGNIVAGGPNASALAAKYSKSLEEARIFEEQFAFFYQQGLQTYTGSDRSGTAYAEQYAIENAKQEVSRQMQEQAKSSKSENSSQNSAGPTGNTFYGSVGRTININLNGKSTSIRVANQTDADALVGTLQELAARS